MTFDFNIYLPKLSFRGKYDLKIKLLLLNIAGIGDLKGVLGKFEQLNTSKSVTNSHLIIQKTLVHVSSCTPNATTRTASSTCA